MIKIFEQADPLSCWNKAKDDEWMFILLARDKAMPSVIRFWIDERIRLGLNKRHDLQLVHAEMVAARVSELLDNPNKIDRDKRRE